MVPVNNYKILFYFTEPFNPSKGGVERVSIVLGKWFKENGCTIFYLSNKCVVEKNSLNHIYLPQDGGLKRKENWVFFKEIILNNSIDIIINQAGIFPTSLPLVELKGKALLLSVMHNTLFGMYTHPNLHIHNRLLLNILETCWAKSILKRLFYIKYHCYFKQIVEGSDAVLLLSESFKKELNYYSRGSLDKVVIIPNPLTIPPNDLIYSKRKEVLFVGRLEYQKRPDLLLDIWKKVAVFFPEWSLRILGDGMERKLLEKRIQREKIPNVYLEGFKSPIPYYQTASILCMTSCYETFGLVLLEAMNYGVVPIAFNSYPNLKDIIENDKDGCIIAPFNINEYADKLLMMMKNERELTRLRENAKMKIEKYNIGLIGCKWIELFSYLKNNK